MISKDKTQKRFLLLVLFCCLPLIGSAVHQGYRIFQIHQESVRTEKKVEELKKENAALTQEKENLGDLKYIEKVARDEHNMVGKNEIPLFMVKNNQGSK